MHVKAPSLTEPLVAVKAKDYGISPDEVDLARAQYERIVPFLVRCWVEGATLVATEGVRAAASKAGLPLDGLTAHDLLSSPRSPVGTLVITPIDGTRSALERTIARRRALCA